MNESLCFSWPLYAHITIFRKVSSYFSHEDRFYSLWWRRWRMSYWKWTCAPSLTVGSLDLLEKELMSPSSSLFLTNIDRIVHLGNDYTVLTLTDLETIKLGVIYLCKSPPMFFNLNKIHEIMALSWKQVVTWHHIDSGQSGIYELTP